MPQKSPYDGPLTLELVGGPASPHDVPSEGADAPKAAAKPIDASIIVDTDNFLAEANREFDQGRIDGPLWTRSVGGANGDKAQAKAAYLRARATTLQALKRDPGAASAAPQAWMPSASDDLPVGGVSHSPAVAAKADRGKNSDATARPAGPVSRSRSAIGKADRSESSDATVWLRSPAGIVAMLTLLVVVATLSYALWPRNSAMEATVAGVAPGGARSASVLTSNPARQDQGQGFMSTIQKLERTRNWNEAVVQALAWTQKEPGNAAAWNELSIGYMNTRQRDDAHAAARRAVELAPKNALYWRNLGDLNLDLDAPVEALLAFEEATSWNTQDTYSFVQTGILNTRLDRLPEAKVAFSKALALNPNDQNARCGAAMIAQRLTPSQANAGARSAAPADGTCRDLIEHASAPVNLMGPTASGGAASGNR